jgi:hypothetical protein
MIKIKSLDLWDELRNLSKGAKLKRAAIAYVSDDSVIVFNKGDILVTDASEQSIKFGRTSAKVLKKAFERGAQLYSCDTLHGKTAVFDQFAYIGSANFSVNSRNHLDEIGVITDYPNAVSGAVQLISGLIKKSKPIDDEYLKAILKIDVVKGGSSRKKRKGIEINTPATWLISLRNDADFPKDGDEEKVNSDNKKIEVQDHEEPTWFFMKKGSFYDRAKVGDTVVTLERDFFKNKSPKTAYRHATILKITDDEVAKVKSYHYGYIDDFSIKWVAFKKLAKVAGVNRLGSGLNTSRQLTEAQANVMFERWPLA